jgi:hypothetical protein
MDDEERVDLQRLDPGEPPELVRGAVRRFRFHVVAFTVLAIVGAVVLTAWGAAAVVDARHRAEEREGIFSPAHRAIAEDLVGRSCETPTYAVGGVDVTLLQMAPMPDGGWAIHFVLDGNGRPLTVQRNYPDGSSYAVWTTLVPVTGGASQGQVSSKPGLTWGETYVALPGSAPKRTEIQLLNTHREVAGSFIVDQDDVLCGR